MIDTLWYESSSKAIDMSHTLYFLKDDRALLKHAAYICVKICCICCVHFMILIWYCL